MLHLKIGICDDETTYIHDITSHLDQYMIQNDVDISYDTYISGKKLLSHITTNPDSYNVLFLDVEMQEIDGLSLAEKIKSIQRNIFIVFVSNYPEYMQDSFRVHPFYYLVKPLSKDTFTNTINDIIATIDSEHKLVTLLCTDKAEETIDIKNVLFIDVEDSKRGILCFHFFDHNLFAKGKLSAWEEKLSDYDFFSIYPSI